MLGIGKKPYPEMGVVYYRSRNVVLGHAIEYLSLGDYPRVEVEWSQFTGERSGDLATGLRELEVEDSAYCGYLSYEAGFTFEKRWQGLNTPESGYAYRFYKIPCWYERNLDTGEATICWVEGCSTEELAEFEVLLEEYGRGLEPGQDRLLSRMVHVPEISGYGELSQEDYCSLVERAKLDISAGRFYELNFTQRFEVKNRIEHPVQVFHHMLAELEPERTFFAVFPDEVICSASPEVFLQKQGKVIVTCPIKGSFVDSPQDTEKLHAEHTMVVDLARNDLGRISDLAPVRVDDFMSVEGFGELHHFVSTVRGETSLGVVDILRATYPAASITGAPKVEVVQAIGELETSCRGLYTGSCGWITPGGGLDLNVAIRTLRAWRLGDGWVYEMGSGGAIVADSDPVQEYEECLLKASPLLSILVCCDGLNK